MKNEDELKFENELLKLKLSAESGAHFSEFVNTPPQVENVWLNYIKAYEEASKTNRTIKLFDKIERPDFSLNIEDEDLPSELERLLDYLLKNSIKVSSICEVSDREFYRFILEDLFKEEILDINHNLGYTCFTYEDFHPNHSYDIGNKIEEFIQALLKKEIGLYSWIFATEFTSINKTLLKEKDVMKILSNFFNEHSDIIISKFDTKELEIEDNKASQYVIIKIEAMSISMNTSITYEGEGKISLYKDFEWWSISGIDLPGLRI